MMSLMVMMTMTMAFAENEEGNATNSANAYDISVNMHSLSRTLNLSSDQYEFVEDVMHAFSAELQNVATATEDERQPMISKIVNKNLAATRSILTKAQYHKYLMLLNVTPQQPWTEIRISIESPTCRLTGGAFLLDKG